MQRGKSNDMLECAMWWRAIKHRCSHVGKAVELPDIRAGADGIQTPRIDLQNE